MSLARTAIRAHYRRAQPVYEALATVQEYPTIGLNDFVGWYIKRDTDDIGTIEAGYPQRGRVAHLDRDFDEIIDRLDRTLYAVTTYKAQAAFQQWEPCRYDEDEDTTVWQTEPPTPDYVDLRAVPAWGDIDLADDLKSARDTLDESTRIRIEETLAAYVEEYAALYGTPEAIYALDSVGGAYIFGAPEATLPITDHFSDDPDALARVFDAFLDRSNEWLAAAEERVNDRIDGAAAVIQPDWVNNKNRQYKPPLALHADHDAVVTPLNPDDIQYKLCSFAAMDEATIERATAWAETFTRVEHTDCVSSLVRALWPEAYDEHEDWCVALETWVEQEREREQERRRQREQALRRRQERLEELGDALEGRPITPFKQDVYEAVEAVDITEIARQYASDAYDTDPNQPRPQFDPCWRHSESGQSCFVSETDNRFGDSKVNGGGGPAKLMALATGTISDAQEDLTGEQYWTAVAELRQVGYDIPIWIPEVGSERVDGETYDQMPFWAVKKAAVALGVCSQDAFIDRETDDGETYEGFPDYETYNDALRTIADAGLKHGREPVTPEADASESHEHVEPHSSDSAAAASDLDRAHLREQKRLLEAKLDRLTDTIDEQAETINRLQNENDALRTQLETERRKRRDYEATLEEQQGHSDSPRTRSDRSGGPTSNSLLTRIRRITFFWE